MTPARPVQLRYRITLFLLALCFAPSAFAQNTFSYYIRSDQASIPAGANGAALSAEVTDGSSTLDFSLCFYTGFGSSTPIVPTTYIPTFTGANITYTVPASTIQQVPPSSFANGSFSALLYTVPISTTTCTAQSSYATVALQYPTLTALSFTSAPQLNAKLTARAPSNIKLAGTNFVSQSSAVTFTSDSVVPGAVRVISPTAIVSTIPTGIDPYVNHVAVQVCNTATYSYCSGLLRLNLSYLPVDNGVVTATPSTVLATQPSVVSATFGSSTPSLAGAPGGLVGFHYASTVLASAPLVLDSTASFVPGPVTSIPAETIPVTSSLVSPLVADFNQDSVPDVLAFESGAATLHLIFGGPTSGSFANDQPIPLQVSGLTILSTAIGDFNSDGFPDVAVLGHVAGSASNTLYLLINDGSGSFAAPAPLSTPVYASSILSADINHDGTADLLLAGAIDAQSDTGLQVLFGDGKGNFTSGPSTSGLNTAASTSFGGFQIALADLNADGFPDVAVLNGANATGSQISQSIQLFQNDGAGNFASAGTLPTDGTASTTFQIAPLATGQLPSILITASTGLSVFFNQSTASIAFSSTPSVTSISNLKQSAVGDFNADGLLDIVVDDGTTVHVLNGDGKGAFTATYTGLSTPSVANTTLLVSDLNLDTYSDLVALTTTGSTGYSIGAWIASGTATATLPAATYPVGVHSIQARTVGTFYLECSSINGTLTVNPISSTVTFSASAVSNVNYGSPITLSATVSDPTATGKVSFYNGSALIGSAPLISGTVATATFTSSQLPAGNYAVTAVYVGDATHASETSPVVQFQILQIVPTLAWATPASIVAGTPLSATQLDAVATGITGNTLPGVFTYTPALGAILTTGAQTLKATFTPTDSVDYATTSVSVSLQVTSFALSSLSSDLAILGDPAKTITLTGTGFVPGASVLMNGAPVTTTFVNSSSLMAVVPAADFQLVQTIQVSVTEPIGTLQSATTSTVPFYVVAPLADVEFSGPTSITPGSQITLTFKLTNPYPVPLTALFTLGFTPSPGLPDDPNILFSTGSRTQTIVIPAQSTVSPAITIQTGTIAGTLSVALDLMAGGTDVTPASVKPLSIASPRAVPTISSVTATANGDTLTVTVRGFSNTRDLASATFHFTPVAGKTISTQDVTIDVGSLFATWYADPASLQYGSEFTYTQPFNLSSSASVVGQVSVTLSNSVGASQEASTQ